MSDFGTQLTITPTDDGFTIAGEIDAHTAPNLERSINERVEHSSTVRLDAADVTFMDSSGLRVLIGATNETRSRGGDLVIARPTAVVRRLIEISGLGEHLTLTGDV